MNIIPVLTIIVSILTAILIGSIKLKNDHLEEKNNSFEVDTNLPSHFWIKEDNFFEEKSLSKLVDIIQTHQIPVILEDSGIESAGEAVPAGHANCKHPYMQLNSKRTSCHFPHRLDIAMHFMKTGGYGGRFEFFEKMTARLMSFRHKLLQPVGENELKPIYGEKFLNRAKEVCLKYELKKFSPETLVTDIFQFDVIIILPGQELPIHLDIPYFWGADRKSLPHWLLVMMKRSNLFNDIFIPQVQGVAWLSKHQYNIDEEESLKNGGNFFFYPYSNENDSSKYVMLKSKYNSAILLDGTQVIHGVERFKADRLTPLFDKNERYAIEYDKNNDGWNLFDSSHNFMGNYSYDDIRISLVWRVHCFKDENEKETYHKQVKRLETDDVLEIFKKDLISKNKLNSGDTDRLELLSTIVNEYSQYPLSAQHFIFGLPVYNYCLLPHYLPKLINEYILNPLLKFIC